jgi:hypothetical protein
MLVSVCGRANAARGGVATVNAAVPLVSPEADAVIVAVPAIVGLTLTLAAR